MHYFQVKGVVCDNHPANVAAYKSMKSSYSSSRENLHINFNEQKIFLFFDTVHILKNVRNNLLNNKRFLFPDFLFNGFEEDIHVPGGEVSWRLLHEVHDKDSLCKANLRKAPKLNAKVLNEFLN